jgi:hypothetical protein
LLTLTSPLRRVLPSAASQVDQCGRLSGRFGRTGTLPGADLGGLNSQLVIVAGAGLLELLVARRCRCTSRGA